MFSWLLDRWYRELPDSPASIGRIERLVVQPETSRFDARDSIELSLEEGVREDHRSPLVSIVNASAVRALAGGDPDLAARSGDQVFVDLDLGATNVPDGGLLTIGEVILTSLPAKHAPDDGFRDAFGAAAARRLQRHNRIGGGGRRLLCKVLNGGTIRIGDKVFTKNVGIRFQP